MHKMVTSMCYSTLIVVERQEKEKKCWERVQRRLLKQGVGFVLGFIHLNTTFILCTRFFFSHTACRREETKYNVFYVRMYNWFPVPLITQNVIAQKR